MLQSLRITVTEVVCWSLSLQLRRLKCLVGRGADVNARNNLQVLAQPRVVQSLSITFAKFSACCAYADVNAHSNLELRRAALTCSGDVK